MLLHNYFSQQKQNQLSESEKIKLYEKILAKRAAEQHGLLKRYSLVKKGVYSFLTLVLIFVFFGTFFWDSREKQDYRAFWTQKTPNINTANADQIWKILEINWEYIIEKEGKQFKNSVLFDGDLISLKPEAKILFNISTDTRIEVQGPAQLRITKREKEGYHLNLLQGDFLTIASKSSIDIIELETQELNIQTEKNKEVRLELSKDKETLQVKNSGATLLVRNKKAKAAKMTQLAQAKVLTIQDNDISKIEDIHTFQHLLAKNQNITHTTKLEDTILPTSMSDLQELEKLLTGSENTLQLREEEFSSINQQLDYQSDKKLIPSEDQLSQISAALNKQFLLSDISQLFLALKEKKPELKQKSYLILSEKVKSIGRSYNIILHEGNSSIEVKNNIDQLIKGLTNYHLPPNKLNQLSILKNWINYLEKDQNLTQEWETLIEQLPQHLKFN